MRLHVVGLRTASLTAMQTPLEHITATTGKMWAYVADSIAVVTSDSEDGGLQHLAVWKFSVALLGEPCVTIFGQ